MASPVTTMLKATLLIIISFHLVGALSSLVPRDPVHVYERATSTTIINSTTKTSNHSITATSISTGTSITTSTSTSTSICVPTSGVYKKLLINFDDLIAPTRPPQTYNYLSFHPSLLVIRNHSFPQASLPNVLFKPQNGTARFRSISPCELFDVLSLKTILLASPGGNAKLGVRTQYFVTFTGTKYGGQKVSHYTAVRTSAMGEVPLGVARDMVGLVDFWVNGTDAMAFDDIELGRYDGVTWD